MRIWYKLPYSVRNYAHKKLHKVNSNRFLLFLTFFRHKMTAQSFKSSNRFFLRIGESRQFPNWVSTNYQVFTRNFLDATKPYGNEICAAIFADNVIEHLSLDRGTKMLTMAHYALVSGGKIRIATPDLKSIVRAYLGGEEKVLREFREDLDGHNLNVRYPADLLRITFTGFGHEKGFIYDFEALRSVLEDVGFVEVKKFLPGESDETHLRNLETRMGKSDMWSQMAVEARKP